MVRAASTSCTRSHREQMKVGQRAKVAAKRRRRADARSWCKRLPRSATAACRHPPLLGADRQLLRDAAMGNDNLVDPFIGLSRDAGRRRRLPRHDRRSASSIRSGSPRTAPPAASATPSARTAPFPAWSSTVDRRARHRDPADRASADEPTRSCASAARTVDKKLRKLIAGQGRTRCAAPCSTRRSTEAFAEDPTRGRRARAAGSGIESAARGARRLPVRPHQALLDAAGEEANGRGRPALDHRQPVHLQGLHGVRRGVRRRRAAAMVTQTEEIVETLRDDWNFWLDLPTTPAKFSRIDDLDEKDRRARNAAARQGQLPSLASGDGACLGCGEKTRHPPVHRHGRGADAAARGEARRQARRPDRRAREAHPHEAGLASSTSPTPQR